MSVKQSIKYNSTNSYFAGFLQSIINESKIKASVTQSENVITLTLDDSDEKKLNIFSELTNRYLPNSIFLDEITTTQTDEKITKTNFSSESYNIALCPKCLEMLLDPSSESYLDDTLICNHYSNTNKKSFSDTTIFSPHYSSGCTLLVVEPSKIDELFIMTEDEIKTLFSIEKPTIKVTIKDELLKEQSGKKFINIKSPYNMKSTLVAQNAKESGISHLFFLSEDDLKLTVVKQNKTIIRATRVATKLKELHKDQVINRFLNIADEAGFKKEALAANLSCKGISFLVTNEVDSKKVIEFQDFVLENILSSFKKDEKRVKLLANFEAKYPAIMKELEANGEFGLFETISSILELKEKSFESVSDKALEFRGNGGLKIDTHYSDNGFDYDSFLGSIISFKLAGVEEHYIAYSIFEAIADMAITTLNQLKNKFRIDKFIMMGDMFENTILYSRILSKFQLSNPHFSKHFALDV